MKAIEVKEIHEVRKYEAVDGKIFDNPNDCEIYEKFIAIDKEYLDNFLNKHYIFISKGTFQKISPWEISAFDYCYKKPIPMTKEEKDFLYDLEDVAHYRSSYFLDDNPYKDFENLPFSENSVKCYDFTNAFSGGHGKDGWKYLEFTNFSDMKNFVTKFAEALNE